MLVVGDCTKDTMNDVMWFIEYIYNTIGAKLRKNVLKNGIPPLLTMPATISMRTEI